MKKWLERFLKKLEEANKKALGDQKMDCCNLNQNGNNASKHSNKK